MKKYGLSAIETVNLLKVNSYPNNGFIDQLLLWENMTYELNGNNCDYRKLVFRRFRDRILMNISENRFSTEELNSSLEIYYKLIQSYFHKTSRTERNVRALNTGIPLSLHKLFE